MTSSLPKEIGRLVKKHWPDGVVEEFDTWESYFHEIHDRVWSDLQRIRSASAFWETERSSRLGGEDDDWDDDDADPDDLGEGSEEFQSYHVFFLSPGGEEFVYEDETQSYTDPDPGDDEASDPEEATVSGERTEGYAVAISLLAPVAAISWSSMAYFEDGSFDSPDVQPLGLGEEVGGQIADELEEDARPPLSKEAERKRERLRQAIAAVLEKHRIRLLDESVLGLPVPGLRPGEEVFMDKPVRVFDAFFFRGV